MRILFERPNLQELKGQFIVDMHFHSRYSHDSSTPIQAIVDRAREMGVHVALTDHNMISGVLEAHRIAPGVVLPGVEITTREGKDILAYFPTVDELELFYRAHVQAHVRNKSSLRGGTTAVPMVRLLSALSKTRALVALAHPFAVGPRQTYRFFRNGGESLLAQVHAFECINQAVPHKRNLLAAGWAMQYDKALIGGSDGHILAMLGSAFTCAKATSWPEFLEQVRRRQVTIVGEEKQLRHHMVNMTRILREKARVLENRRIRNGD